MSQPSGYSKLSSAGAAHCDTDLLNLQDHHLLPQYLAELQNYLASLSDCMQLLVILATMHIVLHSAAQILSGQAAYTSFRD